MCDWPTAQIDLRHHLGSAGQPMKLVTATVPYASAVRYNLIHTEDSFSMRRVYTTHILLAMSAIMRTTCDSSKRQLRLHRRHYHTILCCGNRRRWHQQVIAKSWSKNLQMLAPKSLQCLSQGTLALWFHYKHL